jgi:inner membrane protein
MDNITHTLIGALVGEAAALRRTARTTQSEATARNLLVWVSAIGSNFPDCDVLYTAVAHDKLTYVLEHRGYTHTVIGAVLAGILISVCALGFARRRKWIISRSDCWRIAAMSFFTPLLHITMDFTNNYGVHPFWPWHDAWFYGDTIFIIEPLLWAACAPLAFTLRTRAGRILVATVLVAAVALPLITGLVPLPAVIFVAVVSGVLLRIARSKPALGVLAAIACWAGVTTTFAAEHARAARLVSQISHDRFADQHLMDAVLTPLPANPLCWEIVLVQSHQNELILRRAMLSVMPSIIDASQCPTRGLERAITAPLIAVKAESTPQIKWYGETHTDLMLLQDLYTTDCSATGFMRFARAPWSSVVDGRRVLGDLRFDREPQLGFAEIELGRRDECGTSAPWLPPRADALNIQQQ